MYIKVMFYDQITNTFKGREYSYRCEFPVEPEDIVRVETRDGTKVGMVSRIIGSDELGCDESALKNVVSFSKGAAGVTAKKEDPEEAPQDIITVRQLPIIEERLHALKAGIQVKVAEALSLACTEETVKEVKKVRAELNATKAQLEARRIAVKDQILAPYSQFESVYKQCVTDILGPADKELKGKIDAVENGLKDEKKAKLRAFFDEYRDSVGADPSICDFDLLGINVRLGDSEKALRTQARMAVDLINGDLQTINGLEHADEILAEYRQTRNLNGSIAIVKERHARIDAEMRRREAAQAAQALMAAAEKKAAQALETATAAKETPPEIEPIYDVISCRNASTPSFEVPEEAEEDLPFIEFRVYGTIEQLKAIKKYMNDGGYKYEQL